MFLDESQGPVPPILVKSVYWGLEHMEHPIHTKFNIYEWGGYKSIGNADISSYLF